jgi:hypothetical protein
MDLKQMQYFLCLAQEGNVTRAARQLNIVQPALSMQIAKLERSLGKQLFYRASRGMSLTPAGEALAARIAPIITDIDRARDEIAQFDAEHAAGVIGDDRSPISRYPPAGMRGLFGDYVGVGQCRAAGHRRRQHARATAAADRPTYPG